MVLPAGTKCIVVCGAESQSSCALEAGHCPEKISHAAAFCTDWSLSLAVLEGQLESQSQTCTVVKP